MDLYFEAINDLFSQASRFFSFVEILNHPLYAKYEMVGSSNLDNYRTSPSTMEPSDQQLNTFFTEP